MITPGVAGHGSIDKLYYQKDPRVLCCVVEQSLQQEDIPAGDEIGRKMVRSGHTDAVRVGLCIVDTGGRGGGF